MALSPRTYIKERSWTKLIRTIPEGANDMPVKLDYQVFLALKQISIRENEKQEQYSYVPAFRRGAVTITKIRRMSNGESCEQRM